MQKLCLSGAIGMSVAMTAMADDNTRGIGRYPGNPAENFAPMLRETDHYEFSVAPSCACVIIVRLLFDSSTRY